MFSCCFSTDTLTSLRLLKVDMLLILLHKEHKVDSLGIFLTRILKLAILVSVLETTLCLRLLKILVISIHLFYVLLCPIFSDFPFFLIHRTTWAMDLKVFLLRWDSMTRCKMIQLKAISVWLMPTLFSPRFL